MTTEHTPGPWKAVAVLEGGAMTLSIRDSDGIPVGRAFKAEDAILMVSAPELLAALKALAGNIEALDENAEMRRAVMRHVNATIAKAEGRL